MLYFILIFLIKSQTRSLIFYPFFFPYLRLNFFINQLISLFIQNFDLRTPKNKKLETASIRFVFPKYLRSRILTNGGKRIARFVTNIHGKKRANERQLRVRDKAKGGKGDTWDS